MWNPFARPAAESPVRPVVQTASLRMTLDRRSQTIARIGHVLPQYRARLATLQAKHLPTAALEAAITRLEDARAGHRAALRAAAGESE